MEKCYELIDCPFNGLDPDNSNCPVHKNQSSCWEYDWISFYNKMPECQEKEDWKKAMVEKCRNCSVRDKKPDLINKLIEDLKKA